jgi:hypothetical protein
MQDLSVQMELESVSVVKVAVVCSSRVVVQQPCVVVFEISSAFNAAVVLGIIDFKLWPVEDWKACGAYRCFRQ